MRWQRGLLAGLTIAALAAPAGPGGADEKDEKKAKAPAKAKPPIPSFSDEDLKKYKEQPKDGSTETQTGTQTDSTNPSSEAEGAPRRRRRTDDGNRPSTAPRTVAQKPTQEPAIDAPPGDEPSSAEEADWRARAQQARTPVLEAEGRIQGIEAQIAELRDQLNPMSTKYVLGGTSTAGPGAIYEIEEQLRTLETARGEARTAAAEAEKSWQAFLDEARAAGASPAWLNP